MERFALFGLAHLVTLALVASIAAALLIAVRSARSARLLGGIRIALAFFLLAATATYLAVEASLRSLDAWDFAPLHLCDMAIFVAAFALLSKARLAAEILYFWACSGTLLAMITPDVWYDFPHRHFIAYFALHGGVVISAIVLTFGYQLRPRPRAVLRVFLATNAYAAAVLVVNLIAGANFLYLLGKPPVPTILDLFGPWPIYILVVEAVALLCFWLLDLAARIRRAD